MPYWDGNLTSRNREVHAKLENDPRPVKEPSEFWDVFYLGASLFFISVAMQLMGVVIDAVVR